jgi:hypothetical protein
VFGNFVFDRRRLDMLLAWTRSLFAGRRKNTRQKENTLSRRNRVCLGFERLEDRSVPATFTVMNVSDAGVNPLRWAIQQANAAAGDDHQIVFDQGVSGEIQLITSLDPLNKNITITGPGSQTLAVTRTTGPLRRDMRFFEVNSGKTCVISGLTLYDTTWSFGNGAAIFNNDGN